MRNRYIIGKLEMHERQLIWKSGDARVIINWKTGDAIEIINLEKQDSSQRLLS